MVRVLRSFSLVVLGLVAVASAHQAQATEYEVMLPSFEPLRDKAKVARMIEVFTGLEQMLSMQFRGPQKLRLVPFASAPNAYFNDLVPTLILAYSNISPEGVSKHPKFSEPIWMHEYGHAILIENFEALAPKLGARYRTLVDKLKPALVKRGFDPARQAELEFEGFRIHARLTELKKRATNTVSGELKSLESQFEALRNRYESLAHQYDEALGSIFSDSEIREWEQIEKLRLPYEELGADLIMVAHTGDPSAERRALHFPRSDRKTRRAALGRDFDKVRAPEAWRDTRAHTLFSPARSWIWKYCLSGPRLRLMEREGNKAFVLRKLLEGWGADLDANFAKGAIELEPRKANEQLIWALDNKARDDKGRPLCRP